ncbi:multisubunit sodium/proton antiporter, MrpF subunit [Paracoccus alcaliphilus]|uniref:Multisubunit sodium/proton antiporter, MrpF subunit n=1 Tax=Paracoccus alcaliphilus TaxID=34002 RepID=A0A1H8M4V4_9RHOB|nr:monovalent cation/H+ antiporter complex subunit F [Paracoccus alcaliphilus]WCR18358.1 pH regulation protein F [Paracoccus alcaliphilus]SEO12176.1 multisubunit sodium/proton antiporter, MrpF subunit [Paracoccus alcaliphilus]
MSPTTFMNSCLTIGLVLIALAIAVGFVRLWRGPTLSDRVVALDMMTAAIIAFCGLFAVRAQIEAYLDIAVALALVSFVSVVSLARYAERLARRSDSDD